MMIQNKTARDLLYSWHSGQWSPFYAAASSGLVKSWSELADECAKISEPDRAKLMCWLMHRQRKAPRVCIGNTFYSVLPWVSRTHYPQVK